MNAEDIRVEHVYHAPQDLVVVEFRDGHRAVLAPYRHGPGFQVEGLKLFSIYKGEELIFQWRGKGFADQGGSRIESLADGYTYGYIAAYWQAAWDYLDEEFRKPHSERDKDKASRLHHAWIVCSFGGSGLDILRGGR